MTFSLVARCAITGRFGIAISSSSPAVAARCTHARAGVGAVSTQNITDPRLGPAALDLLALGAPAHVALDVICASRANIHYRQLLAIDTQGRTAVFSGNHVLGINGFAEGTDVAAAGNLLANDGVPAAIVAAFEATSGDVGDRLVAALKAGLAAGGEAGPVHSAGLLIVDKLSFPVADLRVDWDETDPIGKLGALWTLYKPQLEAYVTRALDPTDAPSYGVPGDT
jgi:uncharacterized Ntn-hydrolase superfamily protein